jgi:hypothetical protein
MLAQNFKTAVELGISDAEVEALIKVLGILERGEVEHVVPSLLVGPQPDYSAGYTGHFNMIRVATREDCGTVACILGTARLLCGLHLFPEWEAMSSLKSLFWPFRLGTFFRDIIPAQAAIALRNYLTTGAPRWEEALACKG